MTARGRRTSTLLCDDTSFEDIELYSDRAKELSVPLDEEFVTIRRDDMKRMIVLRCEYQVMAAVTNTKIDGDKVKARSHMQKIQAVLREFSVGPESMQNALTKHYRTVISRL